MAITVELRKGDAEGARSAMRSHVTDTALRAGFEIGWPASLFHLSFLASSLCGLALIPMSSY